MKSNNFRHSFDNVHSKKSLSSVFCDICGFSPVSILKKTYKNKLD